MWLSGLERLEQEAIGRRETPQNGCGLRIIADNQRILQGADQAGLLGGDLAGLGMPDPHKSCRGIGQSPGTHADREIAGI